MKSLFNLSNLIILSVLSLTMNACIFLEDEPDPIDIVKQVAGEDSVLVDSIANLVEEELSNSQLTVTGLMPRATQGQGAVWILRDLKTRDGSEVNERTNLSELEGLIPGSNLFPSHAEIDIEAVVRGEYVSMNFRHNSSVSPYNGVYVEGTSLRNMNQLLSAIRLALRLPTHDGTFQNKQSTQIFDEDDLVIRGQPGSYFDIDYLNIYINGRIWNGFEKIQAAEDSYQLSTQTSFVDDAGTIRQLNITFDPSDDEQSWTWVAWLDDNDDYVSSMHGSVKFKGIGIMKEVRYTELEQGLPNPLGINFILNLRQEAERLYPAPLTYEIEFVYEDHLNQNVDLGDQLQDQIDF